MSKPKSGRVWAPNIPGWDDYPLRAEIRAAVSDSKVKVVVDSDRAASILGEAWQGAARGCRNAIFLAVGTGIGAGILVDGRVLHGAHGIAGAIGWLALDRPFRAEYVDCGCFESHASGEGIAKVAKRDCSADSKNYRGPLRNKSPLTAHDVFAAYEQGDDDREGSFCTSDRVLGHGQRESDKLVQPGEDHIRRRRVRPGDASSSMPSLPKPARWAQPIAMQHVEVRSLATRRRRGTCMVPHTRLCVRRDCWGRFGNREK